MIRLAYFGKSEEPLSLFGLNTVMADRRISVVSVTCGPGAPESHAHGSLAGIADAAGFAVCGYDEVCAMAPCPDMILSFSNSIIFGRALLARVPLGIVNMHPAPLPEYRGSHGIEHCILNGDTRFGATLHYCEARVDTGPIIEVLRIPVSRADNARSLWRRVDDLARQLLLRQLPRLVEAGLHGERVPSTPQDADGARSYPVSSLPECVEIDLGWDWERVTRFVRALDHPRRSPAVVRVGDRGLQLVWRHEEVGVRSVVTLRPCETVG